MSFINFVIPQKLEDLLDDESENYYVKSTLDVKELPAKIKEARVSYKDEGPQFILEYFDTYFSMLHQQERIDAHKFSLIYNDLQVAVVDLTQNLKFILDDKDNLTAEVKEKYQTIMKMLLYLFCTMIIVLENKEITKELQTLTKKRIKRKHSDDDEECSYDKKEVLITLNMFLQCDLQNFWDPPIIEEQLINTIAEVCYRILENPMISSSKDIHNEVFNVFGILLQTYSYDESFLIRLVQMLKTHVYLVNCVAEGIHSLVKDFKAKGLVGDFIREIMEFLMDEKYEDAEGTKHCTATLLEMAKLLPDLMIPEIAYLNNYLGHDSHALRVAILNVMAEVLVVLGAKPELSDNEKELKQLLPKILFEHILDVSVIVRSKVIQLWSKLQKENLIDAAMQNQVLAALVVRIFDKGTAVRKNSASCITSFLEHNCYGAELSLKKMKEERDARFKEFNETNENIKKKLAPQYLVDVETSWKSMETEIMKSIEENSKKDDCGKDSEDEEESDDEDVSDIPNDQIIPLLKIYMEGKKYKEAVAICKRAIEEVTEYQILREQNPNPSEEEFILTMMRKIHFEISLQVEKFMDDDSIKKMNDLEASLKFYGEAVEFLEHLEEAMPRIKQLLTSVNVTEMQEAVNFFVTAYQFKVDDSERRVLELLEIMRLPFEDRKQIVVKALVKVFLVTSTNNMQEHVKTIVDRLIRFIRIVPYDKKLSFQAMLCEWTCQGKLDNSILDMLFSYFTRKIEVSDDESLAALQVLTLAAKGRKTLITNNINMICDVIFNKRGINDMILIAETCNFLAVAGMEKQRVDDQNPPYRLSYKQHIWQQLSNILVDNFTKDVQFYDAAVSGAIKMIYYLSSKPDAICEKLIMSVFSLPCWQADHPLVNIPTFLINRLNFLLGQIAMYQLIYLDETVYKELKRRCNKKEMKKNNRKNTMENSQITSASRTRRGKNNTTGSQDDLDESVLEGAQADDMEADFILTVLEHKLVTNKQSLGAFTPFFLEICENLKKFPDEQVQCGAVLCLLRYMLVSSQMCRQYVELIFKILLNSEYDSVKRLILINLADLLSRFPNEIDPYASKIYERLNDPNHTVKKTAFFILANLLTRDMLRVNNKVYAMALPMVPEKTELSDMSKEFFTQLAKKHTHLYNIVPDMFSYLCQKNMSEEQLRYIMKYLFELMDKNKYMENLVERFSRKLFQNEHDHQLRQIGFCLTLIQYNDKAARKLVDYFTTYKDALHNADLNAAFKQIIASWTKATKFNLKEIANELQLKIDEFFKIKDVDMDASTAPTTPSVGRSAKKGPRRKKVRN